jgi:hypothetical protein
MQYRAEQHGMAFPSQDAPTRRLAGSGLKHIAALQTDAARLARDATSADRQQWHWAVDSGFAPCTRARNADAKRYF